MLYLLLGQDGYSKQIYIKELSSRLSLGVTSVLWGETRGGQLVVSGGDLFSVVKLFVVKEGSIEGLADDILEQLKASCNHCVFVVDKLDQRKTATKKLLGDKEIIVKHFSVPEGQDLASWIDVYLKGQNASIQKDALQEFLLRLNALPSGGYNDPTYSLWQVASELDKLALYSGSSISKESVSLLVAKNTEVEVFTLINAFASRDKAETFAYLEEFFQNQSNGDDKAKAIQLGALLGEQLRNILLVKSFQEEGVPDVGILEKTGWKSGRLSVLKRLAGNFQAPAIVSGLKKLEHLDLELKSTNTPPRVMLDLIISQL